MKTSPTIRLFLLTLMLVASNYYGLATSGNRYNRRTYAEQQQLVQTPHSNDSLIVAISNLEWIASPLEFVVEGRDWKKENLISVSLMPRTPLLSDVEITMKPTKQQWVLLGQYLGDLIYATSCENFEQARLLVKKCNFILSYLDPQGKNLTPQFQNDDTHSSIYDIIYDIYLMLDRRAKNASPDEIEMLMYLKLSLWSKLNQVFLHHFKITEEDKIDRERILDFKDYAIKDSYNHFLPTLNRHHSALTSIIEKLHIAYEDVEITIENTPPFIREDGYLGSAPILFTTTTINASSETFAAIVQLLKTFQWEIETEAGLR